MNRPLVILILIALFGFTAGAQAYTLSGEISGAQFLGGITHIYAVSLDFSGGFPPGFYIGLALLGNGTYIIFSVPEGEYILFAFQDRDYNLIPSIDDYIGFYGEGIPETIVVTGNVNDLDIEVAPMPVTNITGAITYEGSNTGLTIIQAASDPAFANIEHFSILLDTTGTGEYTIFTNYGQYYIRSFIDLDYNFTFSEGDPMGYYGYPVNPILVDVTGGSASGIDFNIYDPLDISVTIEPIGSPIVIPAQGGSFQFEVEIVNNAASPALFNVWIDAVLPSGSVYGPMLQRTLNPGAGFQLTRQLNQSIPGNAPAGEYTYRINAGGYPNFIVEQDSFNFTKSANGDNTPGNYSGWEISEWNTLRNEEYHTAANLTIHKAYPNPFNETTSISFTLNQTAEVYITLYDVQGRRAGQIVRTYYSAGYNSVEISAEGLASGIYILRLESQGRDYYQKLILLK